MGLFFALRDDFDFFAFRDLLPLSTRRCRFCLPVAKMRQATSCKAVALKIAQRRLGSKVSSLYIRAHSAQWIVIATSSIGCMNRFRLICRVLVLRRNFQQVQLLLKVSGHSLQHLLNLSSWLTTPISNFIFWPAICPALQRLPLGHGPLGLDSGTSARQPRRQWSTVARTTTSSQHGRGTERQLPETIVFSSPVSPSIPSIGRKGGRAHTIHDTHAMERFEIIPNNMKREEKKC